MLISGFCDGIIRIRIINFYLEKYYLKDDMKSDINFYLNKCHYVYMMVSYTILSNFLEELLCFVHKLASNLSSFISISDLCYGKLGVKYFCILVEGRKHLINNALFILSSSFLAA